MQQWTIKEISIFSNSSHLEWRADLSDTILKGTHPRTIPARFGLIWFRGFRGEDLNLHIREDPPFLHTYATLQDQTLLTLIESIKVGY
jgi:hypothetical protein